MKKEFKSMFVIGNVVCLLLFTACGGKDSSKSSNKEKAVNDNASTLSLVSGNYTADSESSSVLWECGWLGGNSHNGDVYLEEGLLSIKDNNNLTGSFLVDMTTIDCHDEKNMGTKNKIIGHLKSDDFFDIKNYQKAKLEIISSENIGGNEFLFKGNLTIKGKTNSVQMKGTVQKFNAGYSADINLVFDRSKYDVRYRSAAFFSDLGDRIISDDVFLNVKIKLSKAIS